ncbi:leucine-rich repeat receptor-like tyrosine-protein kinase at2g41820-like protein [Trifolium pratense]|uniref:Leucine-rich repeat receptor-like tyrosine-protein kinase at2g41820-like protein n=2 Tax=Trifolium pratense TaxID=57577 RepID=A0A2K3PEL5_TRIPR|nr:leucine-rich repeat receptor-like tyrosine-protein kinase at2g41820-like protein [Trifolium pratense]PNY13684.1 leucine-rich repeat receptor-like tyrosine-protein kinase at2g41820-like protein [Trifolium pratense]
MINLYNLLNHSDWNPSKNSNPCSWKGVTCDTTNSSVINIVLHGSALSSQSLPVLCKIETLQHLDVSNNHLNSIPDGFLSACGKIENLKLLNFSGNVLSGFLPTFHGFGRLESLDMSFNSLSGTIGLQLDGLVSLKFLNLGYNKFSGNLPTNLGRSMVLEQLVLSNNNFEGTIPDQILSYKNLTVIDFMANQLSGSIPLNIGKLSKLGTLSLSSNKLGGKIPMSVTNITTLERFAANQNYFTGAVPPGITNFLKTLDLSYNSLSESIPEGLLSPSQLVLVDLSYNKLQGPVPRNISPSLVRLRLGRNSLTGEVPSDICEAIRDNQLTYMELDKNQLRGLIPPGLGSCKKLALLNLAENQLTGALPPELGNLSHLQVLQLQTNKLNSTIPIQISQLQKLSTLNLSYNSFDGPIPSDMPVNLTFLDLQGNNLNGSIPSSIGNLRNLLDVQLGENQLSGDIPQMPSSLQIALNLSSNHFSGVIPSSFGDLASLEILDLSNNNFSGPIPPSLTKMSALTQLQLSNNNLSGFLPSFAPYVNVDIEGNNVKNRTNVPVNNSPRKKGNSVVAAVLIAIAAAIFVVGMVTLLVVLISRHYCKVTDERVQSNEIENLDIPQVIQSNLSTPNGIHRSNIDLSKAMEAVAEPSNVTLKTKFSTYYKAVMPSGSIYFAKKLNWCDKIFPVSSVDKFGKELDALAKLNNSNVMIPLGYIVSTNNAYVLYEFVSNGSLFDVLHGSMENSLDWASRYSIAVGVAQGLSFLHGFASGPILLLDLSSKSIMLKSLKEPLVGDIEHYKVIDPSKSTGSFSAVAGSVGYIPPEYAYTMRVTVAGNVYSFGVILLELLTGKSAVTEGTELVKWVLRNSRNQDHILDPNVSRTSQAVRNQMLAILEIALVCVSTSPDARPKMKTVLRMLLNAR